MVTHRLLLGATASVIGLLMVTTVGVAPVDGSTADLATPDPLDQGWITSCTTITEPGRYVLVTDVVNDRGTHLSESCIHITTDDVILDGGGHTVDGRGISGTIGVAVSGDELTNVTVSGLTVSDWDWGVYYAGVTDGRIQHVTVRHNGAGVSLEETDHVTILDSEITDNGLGVFVLNGSDNSIRDTNLSANIHDVACEGPTTDACRNQAAERPTVPSIRHRTHGPRNASFTAVAHSGHSRRSSKLPDRVPDIPSMARASSALQTEPSS